MLAAIKLKRWAEFFKQQIDIPARLILWDGQQFDFGFFTEPKVALHIKTKDALSYLQSPNLNNLAEIYIKGMVDLEGKINDVITVAYALAQSKFKTTEPLFTLPSFFRHSKQSDKKSIQYHYDVSNEFYQHWLDPEMVYSCAYFEDGNESLEKAQIKKIDHILTKIKLQHNQHLLDIGCGWGALIIRAAEKFKARCTGITLSKNQYDFALEKVRRLGLEDRIEVRLQDYRDTTGTFDRITSIGMFEHVGLKNIPQYFKTLNCLLEDDGLVMNHGITSTDSFNSETKLGGAYFMTSMSFPQVNYLI